MKKNNKILNKMSSFSEATWKKLSLSLRKNWKGFTLITPLLIFLIVFSIYPLLNSFFYSLRDFEQYSRIKWHFGISNYHFLVSDYRFIDSVKNSTILFFVASPIAIIVGFLLALVISSLTLKISKNIFITALYSQFFISAFAVSVAFVLLFGDRNVLSVLLQEKFHFGKYDFVSGNQKTPLIILLCIFQLWRAIPFNTVLFSFAINKINLKYSKNLKIDSLSLFDKVKNLYFPEMKITFFNIVYTNFIFAALLYPQVLIGNKNLKDFHGDTLASYIISRITQDANAPVAMAASFFTFIYLCFLLLFIYLLRWKFIKLYIKAAIFLITKIKKSIKGVKNELTK
ncbi:carbohydrate ABC transporter permease [Mesomycoplasma hyorhinis]|uniref:carbohydrate ABC transporter permease n=1 Tax=Mesomycoplasma hyorhinis TaxID=2100 RepID=UPI001C044EF9|nr:sugar ABC transporter permease [Mesomycoplasma hyorhinis]